MKSVETVLDMVMKECGSSKKHQSIKLMCEGAKETINSDKVTNMEVYMLRDKVLEPLQLALESGSNRMATVAVTGIQGLLHDDRFHSSMESELEEQWLPMQILNTVWTCPTLPDEVQVEVMKVLLDMIFSTGWCMNAVIIVRISQLCVEMYLQSSKLSLASAAINTLNHVVDVFTDKRSLLPELFTVNGKVCLDVFASVGGHQQSVKMATRATLNQMLKAVVEKYKEVEESEISGPTMQDADLLAEFGSRSTLDTPEELQRDVLDIFHHFCTRLSSPQTLQQNASAVPLYLEAIATMAATVPTSIGRHNEFQDAVWKQLCPTIVSLLGDPKGERAVAHHQTKSLSQEGELGRGSGVSANAPTVSEDAARAIYKIAVHLVRLVGSQRSMKPVLESLFHRILLYPPPQHRMTALRTMKELWSSGEQLLRLAGPTDKDTVSSGPEAGQSLTATNIRLLKIMVDSIQECCHCGDNSLTIQSVECVDRLLESIDQLTRGEHLTPAVADLIHSQFSPVELACSETGSDKETRLGLKSSGMFSLGSRRQVGQSLTPSESEIDEGVEEGNSTGEFTPNGDMPPLATSLSSNEAVERQCARDYILSLLQLLPTLLFDTSSPEDIDETILKFSSNFCSDLLAKDPSTETGEKAGPVAILNADAVYVTTWVAMHLNLKLIRTGYYDNPNSVPIEISQKSFMDRIFGGGLLLFLSESWLAEVYSLILDNNYLHLAGYRDTVTPSSPFSRPPLLIEMLLDMDGLEPGQHKFGQFLLRHRIAEAASERVEEGVEMDESDMKLKEPTVTAGRLLAKCVLVVCWEGLLDVLSTLLTANGTARGGPAFTSQLALLIGTEGAREECRRAREAVIQSLEGLQNAARLASLLDLQTRCGAVFAQLAAASCQQQLTNDGGGGGGSTGGRISPKLTPGQTTETSGVAANKPLRMHASHALSLDVVLTRALEMGSQAPDCWRHVFRCCSKVAGLERVQFCASGAATGADVMTLRSSAPLTRGPAAGTMPSNNGNSDQAGLDDFYGIEGTIAVAPPAVMPLDMHIPTLIAESRKESAWESARSVLTVAQTCRILCALSSHVDSLFESAAEKLTLRALVHFLRELCKASDEQLRARGKPELPGGGLGDARGLGETATAVPLLLDRISEVLLRCISSDRPVFHLLKLWAAVSPHLTEACCHSDLTVARRAVSCLHEGITRMLSVRRAERAHFHIHEFLCKPVETLLCLEMCASGDIQDQLVCSICELVEACSTEIQSGWRPLFGALRAVKLEFTANEAVNEQRQRHINAVLDVFDVFLSTDNVPVFANAAVDCILCLLKYVKGSGEFLRRDLDADSDDDEIQEAEGAGDDSEGNLCLPALQYLQRCCEILGSMWLMPACPKFKGSERIMLNTIPRRVLPLNPDVDLPSFLAMFSTHDLELPKVMLNNLTRTDNICNRSSRMSTSPPDVWAKYQMPSLDSLDKRTGLLHVWYLLLDGLSSAVWSCPRPYQPAALDTLFELLRSTVSCPGPSFTLYITNRLLLPLLQSWLRQPAASGWSRPETNLRQACGLTTDLVVDFVQQFAAEADAEVESGLQWMLDQLLLVLVECIAQPNEAVSRLGSSCIKHLLTSAGSYLTPNLWPVAYRGFERALHVSFYPLVLLLSLFHVDSDQFYGDSGRVKVAARRDMSVLECERLRQLAHKVFLMEGQEGCEERRIDYTQEEMRNYVFLLYRKEEQDAGPEKATARVQFRSVVYGMLSQQRLLETLKELLLASRTCDDLSSTAGSHLALGSSSKSNLNIRLSSEVTAYLLRCLCDSYNLCYEFDRRPGLKFLLQKVSHAKVAVNLYKQSGVCITLILHSLIDICRHCSAKMPDIRRELKFPNLFEIHEKLNAEPVAASSESPSVDGDRTEADREDSPAQGLAVDQWPVYARLLAHCVSALSHSYLAMLSDRTRLEQADRLASKPLFFLIAQPDEMPEVRLATLASRRSRSSQAEGDGEVGAARQAVCGVESVEVTKITPSKTGPGSCPVVNPVLPAVITPLASQADLETELKAGTAAPSQRTETRESHNTGDSRVYTMASESTIRNLMAEYKRRKLRHSLPPPRLGPQSAPSQRQTGQNNEATMVNSESVSDDSTDSAVRKEQERSILKDSEARLRSWAEMLCSGLELCLGLQDDREFERMLPLLTPTLRLLVAHAEDARLKLLLGEWVARVASVFAFSPSDAS